MPKKCVFTKIVEARIQSEDADGFDHARISIDAKLAKRIFRLQRAIKKLGKYTYIHEFDYTQELLETDYSGDKEELKESETSVDCVQLVVSDHDFWWEGRLKHSDYPVHWETDPIQIEELEAATIPPKDLPKYLDHVWASEEARVFYLKRLTTESKVA